MNIIGLDLGTTTLSAVVLDGDSGAVLETRNIPNGADLPPRMAGERIQDADAIAERALELVGALANGHGAAAIGVDGQMHGILYVDGDGRAVSPLYTWQDQRGAAAFGDSTYAGELSRLSGRPVATGYGMATHFWHAVHRAVPSGAAKLCTVCDYVAMRLTGRRAPLIHVSSAASIGLFDEAGGGWDCAAAERAGIDPRCLPEVTGECATVGVAPGGAPVSCGIGDNQASFIGSVRDMADAVLVNMGTGGQVSMLATGQIAEGDLEVRPLGNGRAIAVGSVLCGGRSYALLERFLRSCAALAGADSAALYGAMNRIALEALDAGDPLRVDTRFHGTRAMPALRGSISGIGTENFDAEHLIAGTVTGMAREIYDLYALMLTRATAPATQLIGSGNAIRRNPALKRAFERAFGMEMRIPAHREEAAYGAALFGMAAAGMSPSLDDAQKLIAY